MLNSELSLSHAGRRFNPFAAESRIKALWMSHLSYLHIHLDHDHCIEVLVVRGKGRDVRTVADSLISTKGVKLPLVGRIGGSRSIAPAPSVQPASAALPVQSAVTTN